MFQTTPLVVIWLIINQPSMAQKYEQQIVVHLLPVTKSDEARGEVADLLLSPAPMTVIMFPSAVRMTCDGH